LLSTVFGQLGIPSLNLYIRSRIVVVFAFMTSTADSLRNEIATRRLEIATRHRAGADAFETCASLTVMIDSALRSAFSTLDPPSRDRLAVFGLGGYGRGELCPSSDVDVMILRPSGAEGSEAGRAAQAFLHVLWDAGLDIGHSVRTADEVVELHGSAVDSWASVLESRFLCGNASLAQAASLRIAPHTGAAPDRWFIEGVFAEQQSLLDRHGNSVKLLEPNVKKSAGGLRDIQSVFWLHRAHRPSFFQPNEAGTSALRGFLRQLLVDGDIDQEECGVVERALAFLLRVRHEMHYQRSSLHDTLEYALQLKVASALGYVDGSDPGGIGSAGNRGVEVFMRDYYLHARTIHAFSQRLGHRYREVIEPVHVPEHAEENIRGLFYLHHDVLSVDSSVHMLSSPVDLFEAFVIVAEREVELDLRLRAVIERSVGVITAQEQDSPEIVALFRRILVSDRVGATLRAMNDLNVLGAYLPEFARLVAFFQHNVYHYFTADEHTIIALENAERLRETPGILREVFRALRRREVLYLAILLHDIAKPDGVADHEITGVAVARRVLARIGMSDAFEDVAFLIRHHLVMEQVAFRRNVHDHATIQEFTSRFSRPEQLDYLYVLTYADLSAVNRNVWTEWKAIMLQELYQRSSEVLRRNLQGAQIEEFHRARHSAASEKMVQALSESFSRQDIERHLQSIRNDSYITNFSIAEIAYHIRASALEVPVSVRIEHGGGYTEITIVTSDAPFALSRFCAVLAANDANIFDANIFTRDDGIIIDRFRVSDATTKQQVEPRVCSKISEDFSKVMEGSLDIEHLFAEHRRRWKRKPRGPVNPSIRTDVVFEDGPGYTIIDVYAADSVGFLYRVTETISRLGLDIYFAKIATRVDGIVDAFYVLDRSGRLLEESERREAVREEILSTIRRMAEEELS
jgi:[protein-PII] uridylyltransferase